MKINKGTERIVLIFKNFVIKIANFPSFSDAKEIAISQTGRKRGFLYWYVIIYFLNIFFYSVNQNWHEFMFYQKTKHGFCAKTYFSFLGFLNIQEKCSILMTRENRIQSLYNRYSKLVLKLFGTYRKFPNTHVFSDPANFGYSKEGKFVCVDYSDKITQQNILDLGDKIQKAFKNFRKK